MRATTALDVRGLVLASSSAGATEDLARPLAGAPLLVRQLEWLHTNGIAHVVINRVPGVPLPTALMANALASTGVRVTWIPSPEPLAARELARRVAPFGPIACVVPHAYLGNSDLTAAITLARASRMSVRVTCLGRSVDVMHLDAPDGVWRSVDAAGWIAEVVDEGIAHGLVESVLDGNAPGIEVRGTAMSPGVFRAHGSFVSARASVVAPCYFGADSYVAAGAYVGPGAVIGEGALVESGAQVVHARVAANAVVGQGIRVERAYAMSGRLVRHGGRVVPLDDELLLGRRGLRTRPARIAASIVAPVVDAAATVGGGDFARLARRLARVAESRGTWLGIRDADDPDAVVIDVAGLLVPSEASEEERAAARAFYARKKSWRLDLSYLADMMRRRTLG